MRRQSRVRARAQLQSTCDSIKASQLRSTTNLDLLTRACKCASVTVGTANLADCTHRHICPRRLPILRSSCSHILSAVQCPYMFRLLLRGLVRLLDGACSIIRLCDCHDQCRPARRRGKLASSRLFAKHAALTVGKLHETCGLAARSWAPL